LSLAQFLLPGESVLYESPGEVYYRRKPFALYVTGERLLLHADAARFGGAERAVAEPLAAVVFLEYEEGGRLRRRGRLHVRSAEHTLTLTGEPGTMRETWQALQRHTFGHANAAADEEATLVAPPPPLFENESYSPARVEPLAPAPGRAFRRRPTRTAVVVMLVCAAALAAVGAAVLLGRRAAQPPAPAATLTPAPPTPTPAPTPLLVLDKVFELSEGSHLSLPFKVPPERVAARLSGGFRVTTGGHVDFYVMRPEQYERFAHGGEPEVTSIVYREEQSNARVGERLPAGDYYLVFDNYDSDDDTQTVAAEFFLLFDE
jgi:hypothetical protein